MGAYIWVLPFFVLWRNVAARATGQAGKSQPSSFILRLVQCWSSSNRAGSITTKRMPTRPQGSTALQQFVTAQLPFPMVLPAHSAASNRYLLSVDYAITLFLPPPAGLARSIRRRALARYVQHFFFHDPHH